MMYGNAKWLAFSHYSTAIIRRHFRIYGNGLVVNQIKSLWYSYNKAPFLVVI